MAVTCGILGAMLGREFAGQKRRPPLIDALEQSVAESEPRVQPLYAGMLREGLDAARRLALRYPEHPKTMAALAHVAYLAHSPHLEAACWEKCLELDRGFAAAYVRLGALAVDQGDNERAVQWMRKAIQVCPDESECYHLLAGALLDLGRPAEASDALETYLARRPASPTILFFLGQAALQLGQFEKAMKAYTRAIEIYPEYANAYHGLATACARLGDEKAAEKWRAKLAALKAKEGASGNAQADLFRDAQFMPARVADVLTVAGDVYEEQGEIEEAAASWRRAAEVCAAAVTCRRRLAALCHRQGEFREAIEVVGQLRQLEPQATEHLRSLAALHAAMDDFEQAELALKKLCELAPRQGDGYAALAEVYARTNKNLPEARSLASTAVRLEPTARHYAIYGVACERLGDLAAARAALERATAIEPDNPQYRRMVDLLKGRQ